MRRKQTPTNGFRRAPPLIIALLFAVGIGGCSAAPSTVVDQDSLSENSQSDSATAPAQEPSALSPTTAWSTATPRATTTAAQADTPTESATAGLLALSALLVRPRAAKAGYSRDQYGQAWSDDVQVDGGGNGCSTLEDILRRDLSMVVFVSASDTCTVLSGTLNDPYTATVIPYLKGGTSPIDIDHMVSLSDSWQSGAAALPIELREGLANDPLNLQAVSRRANQQKGDGDTATWLPPNKSYRCEYVHRQINVKVKYGLWVKPAERDAMHRVLTQCGGTVPSELDSRSAGPEDASTAQAPGATTSPSWPAATDSAAPRAPSAADGGYFANCAAARAAGQAPLLRGEPGYRTEMDGDGDGVACEAPR